MTHSATMDVPEQEPVSGQDLPSTDAPSEPDPSLPGKGLRVALLTGGKDIDYASGLVQELAAQGVEVELVGNRSMAESPPADRERVLPRDFLGSQNPDVSMARKVWRMAGYYVRLLGWALSTDSRLFHILWYYRLPGLEGTLLNGIFRLMGKRLVYTAHNVDDRARDDESSALHRFFLKGMYRRMDHILVHTGKMKAQIAAQFAIADARISVVPHGINDRMPSQGLTRSQARRRLQIADDAKVLLFFGNIAPYKGLELLAEAFRDLCRQGARDLHLVVAGRLKKDRYREYWSNVDSFLQDQDIQPRVRLDLGFIPDDEVEAYFTACDVCVLPYREIYQSGVMILSYGFGVPVIATDVGSLSEEVEEGHTGWVCRRDDPSDLAEKIKVFFESDLYHKLETHRPAIREHARKNYSWNANVGRTLPVYRRLLQ